VIVVMAQNRAEAVTDVPIVIDVVNTEELADAGISDFRSASLPTRLSAPTLMTGAATSSTI